MDIFPLLSERYATFEWLHRNISSILEESIRLIFATSCVQNQSGQTIVLV